MERFADIQILPYRVPGFEELPLGRKIFIYYLSEAALWGRDILFDQNGKHNLKIRKMLEAVWQYAGLDHDTDEFRALETYLKRVWFSSGIHHHYAMSKFCPGFSRTYLADAVLSLDPSKLPLDKEQTPQDLLEQLMPVIFDPQLYPRRVCLSPEKDLLLASSCNYYQDVTQQEAEDYYGALKDPKDPCPVSYGLNSRLVKTPDGNISEQTYCSGGLYSDAIQHIIECLDKAKAYAENPRQASVIELLIKYYQTGDLKLFDACSIEWVKEQEALVDFTNGWIETYGDPLGMKASWEAYVNFKDSDATRRTSLLGSHASWFEQHAPVQDAFRKERPVGVSAKSVTVCILSGDLYPSTAIGINLPNSNWIRQSCGSKSVSLGNIIDAYNEASRNSGLREEFVPWAQERDLLQHYGDITGTLHTDLHECLGHGSGKMLPGVDPDALRNYGAVIEEARADLFGLYFIADEKMLELGLLPDRDAYKAEYYSYMMNGLVTQLARLERGACLEEAHMRNRQLIASWCLEKGKADHVVELLSVNQKTCVKIGSYQRLRELFAILLGEIQRIKSTGDYEAARLLVETYAVKVDASLHDEVLERYQKLDIAPYKGFVNPRYELLRDESGTIRDVHIQYGETYTQQMIRYGREYATLV